MNMWRGERRVERVLRLCQDCLYLSANSEMKFKNRREVKNDKDNEE